MPFLKNTTWAIEAIKLSTSSTRKQKLHTVQASVRHGDAEHICRCLCHRQCHWQRVRPPDYRHVGANNDTSGPDGVMTVDNKQLWVGDGNSRVWVLDAPSGNLVPTPTAQQTRSPPLDQAASDNRADELCFDSADHLVMVANNADSPPFASIISTVTFKVVKEIAFDGSNGAPNSNNGAEQCQWSPRTGKFYIWIPGSPGIRMVKAAWRSSTRRPRRS